MYDSDVGTIKIIEDSRDRHEVVMGLVEDYGVKQIGRGYFGSVLAAANSSSVYKICHDSAYLAFITTVLEFQDNPWFPQILSATLYYPNDEPWFLLVEMERLRKGTKAELRAALLLLDSNFSDLLNIGKTLHVPSARLKKLAEMQRVLRRLFKRFGPDFHKGNVMFRKAHPVIIDPIVCPEDLSTSGLELC